MTSDGNLTHLIDVTGNHSSGRTNDDVTAFWIESGHQHLNRIPKGIEKNFPNLIGFVWSYGSLTTLKADDLKPFPNLVIFSVIYNKLASLDGDLFKHTPKLENINFDNNLLEHVGFGLLDGLNNLTDASFKRNPCIDMDTFLSATLQELKEELQEQCPPLATSTISNSLEVNMNEDF